MSITGSSSGDDCKTSRSWWTCTNSPESVGGPRAGDTGGGSASRRQCHRGHCPLANLRFEGSRLLPAAVAWMGPGSVMNAIGRMSPPQFGHASGNSSPTRARSFAQAIREVSCERGFAWFGAPLYEERSWKSAPRFRECFSPRKDLPGFPDGPIGGGRRQVRQAGDGRLGPQGRRHHLGAKQEHRSGAGVRPSLGGSGNPRRHREAARREAVRVAR
jgi:hypothetical protein